MYREWCINISPSEYRSISTCYRFEFDVKLYDEVGIEFIFYIKGYGCGSV